MEHPRWCINHEDLKSLQLQPTHFFGYFCQAETSLGHHQAVITQESEYV